MLSKEENELLTRVGPSTPAGEMLRRYWWPVGFSALVKEKSSPTKIRLLGEDFVLFRDGGGRLGLVDLHCSHRGTSLEFGRVEDQGLRCCYHGWLYDVNGRCLEQPAEPAVLGASATRSRNALTSSILYLPGHLGLSGFAAFVSSSGSFG